MIVTIDGSAGSGKSTVASKLAIRLGFIHLNSGALFRAVALRAQAEGISLDDEHRVAESASALQFEFRRMPDGATSLLVNGVECGQELHREEAGALASRVAVQPKVRDLLLQVQRAVGQRESIVLEGRDAGSIVFPNADAKFYLDARPEVRAERRMKEVASQEASAEQLEEMLAKINARDHRDSTRSLAPQSCPEGALLIDTSAYTPDEVVEQIMEALERIRLSGSR